MAISKRDKDKVMYTNYGYGNSFSCGKCCNFQKHPTITGKHICIAFGCVDNFDCVWSEDTYSCGLYNKPFLGLSPSRRPIIELVGPKQRIKNQKDPAQLELFTT